MTPSYDITPIGPDDAEQVRRLGWEAFGEPRSRADREAPAKLERAGAVWWGAYAGGDLVATLLAHQVASWWGGVEVPTLAIGDVTVALEHRGAGLLPRMFGAMLAAHVGRDTALSTLYPTAAGVYRRCGYELVGSYDTVEVPIAALGPLPEPTGVRLRRASEADQPAIARCYRRWAAAHDGPLTRTGPGLLPTGSLTERYSGVTVVLDESAASGGPEEVLGFMSWRRGQHYGQQVTLGVEDLVAETREAHLALWRAVASMGAAVGAVRLRTSGADPARLLLPTSTWQVVASSPYALRVVDLPRAVTGRRTAVDLDVAITVAGDAVGSLDGTYRLHAAHGRLGCERVTPLEGLATYTPRGLALAVSGAQSGAAIRSIGQLSGPDGSDLVVDAAFGGRQVHVRDYF